jgi:hypothetical protein
MHMISHPHARVNCAPLFSLAMSGSPIQSARGIFPPSQRGTGGFRHALLVAQSPADRRLDRRAQGGTDHLVEDRPP